MKLQSDDFELFALPRRYVQDSAVIDARWKELQRLAHPDKFAAQGAAAQRVAMQWSVRINEAYQRLKDPLRRAAYLCELHGVSLNTEHHTAMPAEFLMQQMSWREALDQAHDTQALDTLSAEVNRSHDALLQRCQHLLDETQDYAAAAEQLRSLMFVQRFVQDIDNRYQALDQQAEKL